MNPNYKVIKILTVAFIIIMLILSIFCFILSNKNKYIPEEKKATGTYDGTYDKKEELNDNIQEVKNRNFYYVVKNAINKYMDYVIQFNQDVIHTKLEGDIEVTDEERESIYNILYNIYDEEYINSKKINKDQLKNFIKSYKNVDEFNIVKMYYQDINENITVYLVDVSLLNEHEELNKNRIMVKLDKKNRTFSIVPYDKQFEDTDVGMMIEFSNSEIKKSTYNEYTFENIDDVRIIKDFLDKYRNLIMYNKEQAYNLFTEEYRNKRFGNYETFCKFVDNNLQDIAKLSFTEYLVNNYDGYKEYVCKDEYGNLYIFRETAVMDFTLMLDTYTLDNDKFLQKYNSSNDQYKVAMNIDKWVQMLNCRDYRSAFNVLDETFRTTYFNNDVDQFEEYMRQYFPGHYKLELGEFSEETGTYIQKIALTYESVQNVMKIDKTIYMELGEGTDFVMSFNVTRH